MDKRTVKKLIQKALEAREYAYTPYSHWTVGAALLDETGKVWTGCNIENAAYGPSNCAERTAIFKAVSEGQRRFTAIAVVGGPEGTAPTSICPPCGVCRQVMREFCEQDFLIILAVNGNEYTLTTLGELLPYGFGPENIGKH